jgi:hypothetical protein
MPKTEFTRQFSKERMRAREREGEEYKERIKKWKGVILKTNCFPASELQKHKSRKLYLHVRNRPPFTQALKKIAFH